MTFVSYVTIVNCHFWHVTVVKLSLCDSIQKFLIFLLSRKRQSLLNILNIAVIHNLTRDSDTGRTKHVLLRKHRKTCYGSGKISKCAVLKPTIKLIGKNMYYYKVPLFSENVSFLSTIVCLFLEHLILRV